MPLVSCVIPNYNYARYLSTAIDSALAQTHSDVEVIVVDDGSTDGSTEALRSYGERIRWFVQSNQGVSAARNHGIAKARGEFIGILDADDAWHPTKIERQIAMMTDPEVGLVHCWVREVNAEGQPLRIARDGRRGWLLDDQARLRPTVLGGGSGALVRRDCFDKLGGFDQRLSTSADWDMWRRIMGQYRIDLVEEPLLDYRVHASAMHRNIALFEHDLLLAFETMFSDPAAARVRQYRRMAYAVAFGQIAAGHYLNGDMRGAARYVARSLVLTPVPVAQILVRKIRARLGASWLRKGSKAATHRSTDRGG